MKVRARRRVFYLYILMAILFLVLFFPYPDYNNPYSTAKNVIINYSFSDGLMGKIVNSPAHIKALFLYLVIVASSSFFGYVTCNIMKAISYQKSFLISFIVSSALGLIFFIALFLI
ncbi:MAG: hypothetical protein KA792_03900 [Bacteroidales bacterium]|nr:hypothetical protein [Bacteroidales bacterium]